MVRYPHCSPCLTSAIVRPAIVPVPASGLVTVIEGDNATLSCNITRGGPGTYINWEREVRSYFWTHRVVSFQGYPLFWFGPTHTIPNVKSWASALFKCEAKNAWPEPAVAEVKNSEYFRCKNLRNYCICHQISFLP